MLSESERAQVRALAAAALPAGRVLPGAGEDTVQRLETFLDSVPSSVRLGYRALLATLDAQALLHKRRRFAALRPEDGAAVLEKLGSHDATRLALRGLLTPLKLAYLDNPAIHAALGIRYALTPPTLTEAPRWRSQVVDAASCAPGETLECDAVVVGTGAGGASAAKALAARGYAVLMVEEGQYFTRKDFTGRPVEMIRKLYRRGGLNLTVGNTVIAIPTGKGVGGTTLINSGTCFRAPDATLRSWQEQHGLRQFTPEHLAPYYDEVERVLEVGPSTSQAVGAAAEVIGRGCAALGYRHQVLNRNAPGCDGQGLCCFGCPTDAKRSTNVSFVPAALQASAQLLTGFQVRRILTENERAVGISGVAQGAQGEIPLTVRARIVVVACGTLVTPLLLAGNGLCGSSGQLGRNLSIHPATSAVGFFDQDLRAWNSVPQGYAIHQFHQEGLMFEGAHAPLELTGVSLTDVGPAYVKLMEQYNRSLGFGFMVKDTSRGRVIPGPHGEQRILYWLNERDLRLMHRGLGILARVLLAAGAREVQMPLAGHETVRGVQDVERLESATIAARHIDITAHHPLGTARMGTDAFHGVVDATQETFDVHNLFISDGSVIPGSLGVNPQVTIMALGLRAAEFMARRLERLDRQAA